MTTSNLERVIEKVKALTPDDQRKLCDFLDSLPASTPQMSEEVEPHLLAQGIISEIPQD